MSQTFWEGLADPETVDDSPGNDEFSRAEEMFEVPVEMQEEKPDEPDSSLLEKPKRKPNALQYEKKVNKVFGVATRVLIGRGNLPDAATLLMYGPDVAESWGDLAAENDKIARMLSASEQVTDNAVLAAVMATLPLVTQIARNHEPTLEPARREFTIPILKRSVKLPKIGVRLGIFRNVSDDPDALANYVFNHPKIRKTMEKHGIHVQRRPSAS